MKKPTIAQRIWRRAVAMLFVAMRYEIELRYTEKALMDDDEEFSNRIWACLVRNKLLYDELTQNEIILLQYDIGEWPRDIYTQYSWHVEAVGCLLWVLQEFDSLPSHDTTYTLPAIDQYFGNSGGEGITHWTKALLEKEFTPRSGHEVQLELKRAEIVYQRCIISWKMRNEELKLITKKYSDIFPFEKFGLPTGPGGDLIVCEKEFCDISEDEEGSLCPLALIRVQTFRWVMDPSEGWDNMSVDYLDKLPI